MTETTFHNLALPTRPRTIELRGFQAQTVLTLGIISLGLDAMLRLLLVATYGTELHVSWSGFPSILLRGILNDLVVLPAMLAPLVLLIAFVPRVFRQSRIANLLLTVAVFTAIFGRIYFVAIEFFFFEEFSSRLNLVAVDYLVSTTEVMVNIWESYPVPQVLLATAGLAAAITALLRRFIRADLERQTLRSTAFKVALFYLVLAISLPLIFSTTTFAKGSRYSDQMSFNGVSTFFLALRTNDISYPDYYRMLTEDRAFAIVRNEVSGPGDTWASHKPNELRRHHPERSSGLRNENVVVIVEESLGCEHVDACGGNRQLTPNLDKMAPDGIFFPNAWATGTRTVRGLEAILTSLPPIPSKSVLKRPGSDNVANWGRVMKNAGYHASFLYGGYGTFDDMNHFFASNGFDVSDRREIDDPIFANIWGVSDEDLFNHALNYFDERGNEDRPFFSVVLTTSNHKPFTFREGVPGVPAQNGGRDAGVRYADFALGEFFREARTHAWYDQTVFIVLGDHGSRVYGRGEIPMPTYRIPILIYGAPVAPRVVANPTSQIDVAPTLLGLLGVPYTAPFYGRDVIARPDPERPIFVSHNHDVGMLVGDRLAVLGLQKTSSVFQYDEATDTQTPLPFDQDLVDLATATYETAFLLFSRGEYQ